MEKDYKWIKDPIYGYIKVDSKFMKKIVDTACFQRLRNIIQTSYSPLYSAAVHNRFIHSLGVFHLGQLALKAFCSNENQETISKKCDDVNFEDISEIFLLACLLHDVGHAPFSHTGENFYCDLGGKYDTIHGLLIEYVEDSEFEKDVEQLKKEAYAKPHEVMSVIVSLKEFGEFFQSPEQKSLFARCITGYLYKNVDYKTSLYNCLISLLNSSIIDVDKLDYLIRDSYITGFDTVKIDYIRLLGAIRILDDKKRFVLAYNKNAVSVIENVIYAHDAERHWIQNHPIVVYESYLLKTCVEHLNSYFGNSDKPLFSLDSLSEAGTVVRSVDGKNEFSLKLLEDDDIIFLMKNICFDEEANEFFSRKNRRHSAWKSEAEYKAIFYKVAGRNTENMRKIETMFENLSKFVKNVTHEEVINQETLKKCKNEKIKIQQISEEQISHSQREEKIKELDYYIKWLKVLEDFADTEGIAFDFLILKANQFNSGFQKADYGNIKISFPNLPNYLPAYKEILTPITSSKSDSDKFFYLFYRKNEDAEREVDFVKLAKKITHIVIDLDEIYMCE